MGLDKLAFSDIVDLLSFALHRVHASALHCRRAIGLLTLMSHLPVPLTAVAPLAVQGASLHCNAVQTVAM